MAGLQHFIVLQTREAFLQRFHFVHNMASIQVARCKVTSNAKNLERYAATIILNIDKDDAAA